MSTIIRVEGLGKSYFISHEQRERYIALRDVMARKTKKIFSFNYSANKQLHGSTKEEFWALKDINFEVNQGDRIGIIGRNGAGKSTLLKILSRITEPTTGSAKIKGRVASLLEVGTGFHPELTGAENIYLNGAILGMSRTEVKKKFDEIVDFAGTEKFLDTPVKRYSSGMYVRLAFAVAAHLEPEILFVDEVLAVGDAEFQKKCLGKMEDVSKNEGRTILFVSHNISAVQKLCNQSILLKNGKLVLINNTEKVIKSYSFDNEYNIKSSVWVNKNKNYKVNDILEPIKLSIVDENEKNISIIRNNYKNESKYYFKFEFNLKKFEPNLTIGYSLFNSDNIHLYRSLFTDSEKPCELKNGINILYAELPVNILNEDDYKIILDGGVYKKYWLYYPFEDHGININFNLMGEFTFSDFWETKRNGILAPLTNWLINR